MTCLFDMGRDDSMSEKNLTSNSSVAGLADKPMTSSTHIKKERAGLAAEINREHELAEQSAKSAIEHAIRCGELLLQAKEKLKHGGWLKWLETNFNGSSRTAQAYAQIAKGLPSLPKEKAQRVADLPIRQAVKEVRAHQHWERAERKREILYAPVVLPEGYQPPPQPRQSKASVFRYMVEDIECGYTGKFFGPKIPKRPYNWANVDVPADVREEVEKRIKQAEKQITKRSSETLEFADRLCKWAAEPLRELSAKAKTEQAA